MKVKELMSTDVKSCREETDLATVVRMMWDGDCGIVPVVDDQLHVTGVVTDRDICVAVGIVIGSTLRCGLSSCPDCCSESPRVLISPSTEALDGESFAGVFGSRSSSQTSLSLRRDFKMCSSTIAVTTAATAIATIR